MEMVMELDEVPRATMPDAAADPEPARASDTGLAGRRAVSGADVRAMRAFLAGWEGDVRAMLAGAERHGPGVDR